MTICTKHNLGLALRRFRTLKGWTQSQLAEKAQVLQITISNIELGKTSKIDTLLTICTALDVEIAILPKQKLKKDIKLSKIFK